MSSTRMRLDLVVSAAAFLVIPAEALAYLDPGTGSYIFQLLLAFFLTAGVVMRAFWGRVRMFFEALWTSILRKRHDKPIAVHDPKEADRNAP